jgi:DNA polymerase III subunit epsilon
MNWLKRLLGTAGNVTLEREQQARLDAWRKLPAADNGRGHFLTRYVVVDVEASGLNMVKDRLISIGAVAVGHGAIDAGDAFEVVLRQDEVSTHENILIHGIGGSAQRDGVEPVEALLRFLEYAGKAPLVAYHAEFDERMIAAAMKRFLGVTVDMKWIDLAWILPELFPERIAKQAPLDDWLQQFAIENILRHNAVSDAYATAKLLQVAITHGAARGRETADAFIATERARRRLRRVY